MGGFYDPVQYLTQINSADILPAYKTAEYLQAIQNLGFAPAITPTSTAPVVTQASIPGAIIGAAGSIIGGALSGAIQRTTSTPPLIPAPTQTSPLVVMGPNPLTSVTVFGRKKHRRMNPLNPRALRRAIRRAKRFEHFAHGVMTFPFHKKAVGRGVFKRKRK